MKLDADKFATMEFHGSDAAAVLAARSAGASSTMSSDERKDLLRQLRAGEPIELEIDLLAFEQIDGQPNRNGLRFKASSLSAFAKSGVGSPFIADHRQGDINRRGGTILKSTLEKVDKTHQRILQTAKVTVPWAVEGVLMGTIDRFSIGWRPTGPVNCTACKASINECSHWPLDSLEDGRVVEWEFSAGQLVETSAVTVPAVPSTQIGEIRAALASVKSGGRPPEEKKSMSKKALEMLGLAATAGDDEMATAVKELVTRAAKAETKAELASENFSELSSRYQSLEGQMTELATQVAQQGKREFLAEARLSKGVIPGSKQEATLARMFDTDPEWARTELNEMPRATPTGAPRQSASPEAVNPGGPGADHVLREYGFDPDIIRNQLTQLGIKDPDAVLAKRIAKMEKGA